MRVVGCAVLAVLLAGCAADPSGSTAAVVDGPDVTVRQEPLLASYHMEGHTVLAYRLAGAGNRDPQQPLTFTATEDTTAILVELAWDDDVQDLDPFLSAGTEACSTSPGVTDRVADAVFCVTDEIVFGWGGFGRFRNPQGDLGAPDSPSRLVVNGAPLQEVLDACIPQASCTWSAWGDAHVAQADVPWTLAVSLFRDGPVPEGYTALPAAP